MAITNINRATHLDKTPLNKEDIKLGLEIYFPSGSAGILKNVCVFLDDEKAVFEPINKEWPERWGCEIEFNAADFSLDDFKELGNLLESGDLPDREQTLLLGRARELGYAYIRSTTQFGWTEIGFGKYKEMNKEEVKSVC